MNERLKDFVDIVNNSGMSLYVAEREDGASITITPHWFIDKTLIRVAHSNGHASVILSTEKLLEIRDYLNAIFTDEPRLNKPSAGGSLTISPGFFQSEESPEEKAYSDVKIPYRAAALQNFPQEED